MKHVINFAYTWQGTSDRLKQESYIHQFAFIYFYSGCHPINKNLLNYYCMPSSLSGTADVVFLLMQVKKTDTGKTNINVKNALKDKGKMV